MKAWIFLLLAGGFEIVWAVGMKYSHGWTKMWPSIITLIAMVCSVIFLSLAIKYIPLGTAYAIWTGLGAAGTALAGIWLFGESANAPRMISLAIIVIGIVALKLTSRA